jgi:hypothetical protein
MVAVPDTRADPALAVELLRPSSPALADLLTPRVEAPPRMHAALLQLILVGHGLLLQMTPCSSSSTSSSGGNPSSFT